MLKVGSKRRRTRAEIEEDGGVRVTFENGSSHRYKSTSLFKLTVVGERQSAAMPAPSEGNDTIATVASTLPSPSEKVPS